jgi:hypothetical protein
MRTLLPAAVAGSLIALAPLSAAHAVDYGFHIFISAPDVQGPPMSTDRDLENFDSYPTGTCPTTIAAGTISGDCQVYDAATHGGAGSESASPSTGGSGTRFPATDWSGDNVITITLSNPTKYLGFWWSAGNAGNTVAFYSNGDLVASMDSSDIVNYLNAGNITSVGGTSYTAGDYYGNPVSGGGNSEAYVFLNLYAQGGTTFDTVVLSGGGFEFDNLTTSATEFTPDDSLAEVEFIQGLVAPEGYSGGSGGSGGSNKSNGTLAATGFDVTTTEFVATVFIAVGAAITRRRHAA